jgi:hypothetical protein
MSGPSDLLPILKLLHKAISRVANSSRNTAIIVHFPLYIHLRNKSYHISTHFFQYIATSLFVFTCLRWYLDGWTEHLVVSFVKDQQMLKEVVDFFINTFQILPRHVSAYGYHPQGVVSALQATQAERINKKSTTSLSICWSFYKRCLK